MTLTTTLLTAMAFLWMASASTIKTESAHSRAVQINPHEGVVSYAGQDKATLN